MRFRTSGLMSAALILMLSFGLSLAACGDDGDSSKDNEQGTHNNASSGNNDNGSNGGGSSSIESICQSYVEACEGGSVTACEQGYQAAKTEGCSQEYKDQFKCSRDACKAGTGAEKCVQYNNCSQSG